MVANLAEEIVESPVGSVVLALLELGERGIGLFEWDGNCDEAAVERANGKICERSYPKLLQHILVATSVTSPFNPDCDREILLAHSFSERRMSTAETICDTFGDRMSSSLEIDKQILWLSDLHYTRYRNGSYFVDFNHTYGEGQFTWAGLWSVSPITEDISEWMVDDMGGYDILNCYRPVLSRPARVYEVHCKRDWVSLVHEHRLDTAYERTAPDWQSISKKYDAIHLSWMGVLTAHDDLEFAVTQNIIPLRYWSFERTHWLQDCFEELAVVPMGAVYG